MNIKPSFLSLHGHFYQPPYGDPFERRAENANASQSWHEAANANCYHPNAALGNFERISFSAGNALLSWLAIHDREVYQRILMSDRLLFDMGRHGNAVAVPLHHTLLPLADMRDKLTQVRWGIADFVHRYGRRPRGRWLPEMAVDMETLAALHDA
ncbi:MAG: glycoside hydrolase, partial [Anaerolineales bacterium]